MLEMIIYKMIYNIKYIFNHVFIGKSKMEIAEELIENIFLP